MNTTTAYVPAPLPGTGRPLHGLFVDRWGTLLDLPAKGWCSRFRDAAFVPGALDALFRASQAGWLVYLIGNEEAVAHGLLSDEKWERFEADFLAHVAAQGIPIRHNYACVDHPEGEGEHQKDSVFLLPNTGAFYHAMQHDGIRLAESWVIGDSSLELSAAWRAGMRTAAVRTGLGARDGAILVEPELEADDLAGAIGEILATERLAQR